MDSGHEAVSNRVLYIVSLNHFINDSSANLISSLFPAMIVAFGFSTSEVGVLVAVGYLVNMVFQPLTGRYSERFEARKLLALGISVIAVSMILFAISNTFALMLFSIIILRFGSSFFHPVGVSSISRNYTRSKLDSSMGIQSAFGNLGIVLIFVFSAPIYVALGWRAPFLIFAGLDLVTVAITLAALTQSGLTSGHEELNVDEKENPLEKSSRLGLPWFFILTTFISGGTFAVLTNYGNLLLFQNGFGLTGSNYIMTGWVLSGFVGALGTGYLTRAITREKLMPMSYLISSIAVISFAIFPANAPIAIGALVACGFTLAITYPTVYSELSAYLGEKSKKKGSSFGILFSAQIAGASIMGFASGIIAGALGLQLPFLIVGAMLIVSAVFSAVWMKTTIHMNMTIASKS